MPPTAPPPQASPADVPELVAAVFEAAPLPERKRLLELMIRPLGVLSLAAVANGIFAQIALRSNWTRFQLQTEDVQAVQTDDVVALAHYVQQAGAHAFDGMRQLLMGSPALMGTTAAAVLLTLLTKEIKRRNARAATEKDFDPPL
ncbi:hypothetical protein [uncultured Rhodoferax sp.]|uniref:hypothetical protein n=1 Tax=uncultured Rhodoferax sp. TaxID=223188 RepID=UPI0025D353E1|nr:hypothetical protein [uncultured Rhodoferax sp.]